MIKSILKYGSLLLLFSVVAIALTLPASRAYDWAKPPATQLTLYKITGTVWHGAAGYGVVNGLPLKNITWDIIPQSLLSLAPEYTLRANTLSGGSISANVVAHNETDIDVKDIKGAVPVTDLKALGRKLPMRLPQLAGDLDINIPIARIRDQWLREIDGEVGINGLAVKTRQLETLGDYIIILRTADNIIRIDSTDVDRTANVGLDSNVTLFPDGRYETSFEVIPRKPPKGFMFMFNAMKRADGRYWVSDKGKIALPSK